MNPVIDPQFSVYQLVERMQSKGVVANRRRTMSMISYEIENALLVDGAQTRIFAGFQRLSRFLPQRKRYERLAELAESVFIFGVPDIEPPIISNLHYLPLMPTDQLSKEWFVVAYGQDYCSALATEELSEITDPDEQRTFKGVWTFDDTIVSIMHDWLTSAVDARPLDAINRDYRQQVSMMERNLVRLASVFNRLESTKLQNS